MAEHANLLVELFVEELPPKALQRLGDAFAETLAARLKAQGLAPADAAITAFASPRRLAVHITDVAARAADKPVSQKLMPVAVGLDAVGAPTPALLKKLAALGADASVVPQLARRADGKADALFLDTIAPGVALAEGLQSALDDAIRALPIPKVMTYQPPSGALPGWSSVQFVRPAHGLVALHGDHVVPVTALGLVAGRDTHGHRFEARVDPVVIPHADRYETRLADDGAVIARFAARRDEIARQVAEAARREGLTAVDDPALLDEVTALVERPNVLVGHFDAAFLDVPQECLILTMKANQKYFPLLDADGKLSNRFLIVSNIRPADASAVIGGNERVVRPRLADAKFFYDQDRRHTLESRVPQLAKVVYHGKLGSQGERVERVRAIAKSIADKLGSKQLAKQADRAALLSKADLLTNMVGEFPELQGVMGGYYARHDGELGEVAEAIEDHYRPRFAGDSLPRNEVGVIVALADKLETLVGLFAVGQAPTGDKDPFALRRHALGVIRLLVERSLPLSLQGLLLVTLPAFPQHAYIDFENSAAFTYRIWLFVLDRARTYLRDLGFTSHEVDAVLRVETYSNARPMDYPPALRALRRLRTDDSDAFSSLAASDKRARNIIGKATGLDVRQPAEADALPTENERALLKLVRELDREVRALIDSESGAGTNREQVFAHALRATVRIAPPVAAFFDHVMVNVDDQTLRVNRLRLLNEVTGLTGRVADLSRLAA